MPSNTQLTLIRRYEAGEITHGELNNGILALATSRDIRIPKCSPAKSEFRDATDNNGHTFCDRQWEAQFWLYGVPFKEGDDMRGVAVWALEEGLFSSPSPEVKTIEASLEAQYELNKEKHVKRLKNYYAKKASDEAIEKAKMRRAKTKQHLKI